MKIEEQHIIIDNNISSIHSLCFRYFIDKFVESKNQEINKPPLF